ncbi:hypothetical protein HAX54_053167, partial [Datura stramonium]|nr:hypothetical protein [Datura stramonium]
MESTNSYANFSDAASPILEVTPLQFADNDGIPIAELIPKKLRSLYWKTSGSSIPVPAKD